MGERFAIEPVHIPIEPILVELAKVLFQNVLFFLRVSGISFPYPDWRASVLFRQTTFQRNRTLDSLNCGAHSGALRPYRISKT